MPLGTGRRSSSTSSLRRCRNQPTPPPHLPPFAIPHPPLKPPLPFPWSCHGRRECYVVFFFATWGYVTVLTTAYCVISVWGVGGEWGSGYCFVQQCLLDTCDPKIERRYLLLQSGICDLPGNPPPPYTLPYPSLPFHPGGTSLLAPREAEMSIGGLL